MILTLLPSIRCDARRVCGTDEGCRLVAILPKAEGALVEKALAVCAVLPCPRLKAADLTGPLSTATGRTQAEREWLTRCNRNMRSAAAELARALGPLHARPGQVAYLWIDHTDAGPVLEAYNIDEGATCRILLPESCS